MVKMVAHWEFELPRTMFAVCASCVSSRVIALFVDLALAKKWMADNSEDWTRSHPGSLRIDEVHPGSEGDR